MNRTGTEIVMTGLGGPEVLSARPCRPGEPGPHGVVVRVEATGVAFAEVQMLRGRYPAQPGFPFVPGYDLVGEVVSVGEAVTTVRVGQRVAAMPRTGAWADYVEVRDREVVVLPAGVDAAEAVSLVLNGVTAWQMLHRVANVRSGQTVLIHGAGGGVGTVLAQLCALAGVRAIGTASARRHETLRPLGAELIDHRTEDVPARVRDLAPGGVAAVFDPLGAASLDVSWNLLAPKGILVAYGSSASLHDTGPWWRPFVGILGRLAGWELLRLLGRTEGRRARLYYIRADDAYRKDLIRLTDLLASGQLRPLVARRFPLEEASSALESHISGQVTGKIVLLPGLGGDPGGH